MARQTPDVGDRVGRYLLTGLLGRGGMGTVYAASDDALERTVALKLINPAAAADPEYRARFRREAVAMSRLDSPHVVTVHDHGEHEGSLYIVTQLVSGGDLHHRLQTGGPLPPEHARDLARQVLDGLEDAHRAGIVHRDIKPSNVLLSADGRRAYLCDFGIASSPDAALTRTGALLGSIGYMAPERHTAATAGTSGAAGDIYAAGCLLWAMLTATPPYAGTDYEVASGHLYGDIPQLPGRDAFSAGVNQVLTRSMAKDPRARYASAADMRAALDALTAAPAGLALPDPTAVRRPPLVPPGAPTVVRGRRRRVPMILMGVLTAVALVLAITGIVVALQRPRGIGVLTGAADASITTTSGPAAYATTGGSQPDVPRRTRHGAGAAGPGSAAEPGPATAGAGAGGAGGAGGGGGGGAGGGGGGIASRSASAQPTATSGGGSRPGSTKPAGTTTSAAPAAYQCWNGNLTNDKSTCGYPNGIDGLHWMFPNLRTGGCSPTVIPNTSSATVAGSWKCPFATGTNAIYIVQWKSHKAAVDHYGGNGYLASWPCGGGYDCGTGYRRVEGGSVYVSTRIYRYYDYWSFSVRATSGTNRQNGFDRVGAVRLPPSIQAIANPNA